MGHFWSILVKYDQLGIFLKNLALSVFDYWPLASCKKKQKKTNESSLRKNCEQTDGQNDDTFFFFFFCFYSSQTIKQLVKQFNIKQFSISHIKCSILSWKLPPLFWNCKQWLPLDFHNVPHLTRTPTTPRSVSLNH